LKRPYISKALNNKFITQTKDRCGYYLAPQYLLAVKLEIEHIIPLIPGDKSNEKNL